MEEEEGCRDENGGFRRGGMRALGIGGRGGGGGMRMTALRI